MIESKKLCLLDDFYAPQSLLADAEFLNQIPNDKINEFINWAIEYILKGLIAEEGQFYKIAKKVGLKTAGEAYSASRLLGILLYNGAELTTEELEQDLTSLGFKKDKIDILISALRAQWVSIEPVLQRRRLEALPKLWDIRWRVDVRYASNNYFKEPEVIAILRIETNDGQKKNHMHLEMGLERLSWLESTIVKLKKEMLTAQEKIKSP
jgi:hypothetical protein